MNTQNTLDIAIPVLNEESSLEQNVVRVLDFLHASPIPDVSSRILIADNGSRDNTPEIARRLSAQNPALVEFVQVPERGVGLALKHAWTQSTAEIVGYMDLDLATDLKHLNAAVGVIQSGAADVSYGSRLHRDSRVVGRSIKREVTSRTFNTMMQMYFGSKCSDAMCGFKFLARRHLEQLMTLGATSDGWFFCAELLMVAETKGLRLAEIPVHWTDSPESNVKVGKLSLEFMKAMRSLKNRLKTRS